MVSTSDPDGDLLDQFLDERGHDTDARNWDRSYNKKQCPDCGGLHGDGAAECSVCGWSPAA